MDDYEELLAEQEEEQLAEALAEEHQAELEVQLEQDEQPPQIDEPPETKKLKRDLQREALARLENAARTTDDFKKVIAIPYDVNDVLIKQIRKGDYIDVIFHCPFELNELVTDGDLSKILYKLSDDHKEIIFNTIVRNMSTKALSEIREQSDRNIRKVRATALKKIHNALLKVLLNRKEKGYPLTMEEKQLIEKALDDSKSS